MKSFCAGLLLILFTGSASASHLLGGYIQVKSQSPILTTQEITVFLFLDGNTPAAAEQTTVFICFGDGTSGTATRIARTAVGDNVAVSLNAYRIVHQYPFPNRFTITASLFNRSSTLNLPNVVQAPMTLQTAVMVGLNNTTPVLPVLGQGFLASINQVFTYPFGSVDADGDSLAYVLTVPLVGGDNCKLATPASGHLFPNELRQRGTFKLNSRTGELVWNAPIAAGNHAFAVIVEEWRNGQLISQTTCDRTLSVRDAPGTPGIIPPYEPVIVGALITAVTDAGADLQVIAHPNPATDRLTVNVLNRQSGPVTLQLLDLNGRMLLQQTATDRHTDQTVDLQAVPSGVYLLNVQSGGRQVVQKVLRQ